MNTRNKVLTAVVIILALALVAGGLFALKTFVLDKQEGDGQESPDVSKSEESSAEDGVIGSGEKTLTIEVIAGDSKETLTVKTDAGTLREALEPHGIIAGSDSEYGLFVTEVRGRAADSKKEEWWQFSKDGEPLLTSTDQTEIADGEHYTIELITGYGNL